MIAADDKPGVVVHLYSNSKEPFDFHNYENQYIDEDNGVVEFGQRTSELTGRGQKPGREGAELELSVEHAHEVFAIKDRDKEDEG